MRERNTNTPISGATVRLEQGGQIKFTATTNASGVYSITGVPSGTYNLVCLKLGCYQNWGPFARVLGDLTGQNIVMERFASITGGVRDAPSSAPISGATVRLEQGGLIKYVTTTDGSGVYSFDCIPPGTYDLVGLELSCHVNWSSSRTLNLNDHLTGQNIAMDKFASITGGVRDAATSDPIGGATVRLEQGGQIKYTTTANSISGVYSFNCVLPGTYNLVALKLDKYFNWGPSPRTLNANDILTGQNIAMTVMPTLSGGIRDGCEIGSVPVGGVTVTLTGPVTRSTTTHPISGVYQFDYLPDGTYHVHIDELPGAFTVTPADADRDILMNGTDSGGHNARMLPYRSISGRSTSFESHNPVANDRITITNSQTGLVTIAYTDANGDYTTPSIAQGAYSIGAGSCDDTVYFNQTLGCEGLTARDFQQKGLPTLSPPATSPGADGRSIIVSWSGGNAQTAHVDLYRASTYGGTYAVIDGATSPYIDGGMTCRQSFFYKVSPINECARIGLLSGATQGTNSTCAAIPLLTAPTAGAAVVLPDRFSWIADPVATSFEVEVSASSAFAAVLWSSQTAQSSIVVPSGGALASATILFWRVRARVGLFTSDWSEGRSFIRVTATPPPGPAALVAPPDGALVPGGPLALEWSPGSGATSYRLEISSDVSFPGYADRTTIIDPITSTAWFGNVPDIATTLFWRVTSKNGSGTGPIAGPWSLQRSGSSVPLSALAILGPDRDISIEAGSTVNVQGMVVGTSTGPVDIQWTIDDDVIYAESILLNGIGSETNPATLPALPPGTHELVLSSVDGTVASTARIITVVSPDEAQATGLAIVTDDVASAPGDTIDVFATVRDGLGNLVATSTGIPVHFSTSPDVGTFLPADATVAQGVAATRYLAGGYDGSVSIQVATSSAVSRPGVTLGAGHPSWNSSIVICSSTSALAAEKCRASSLLDNLESLSLVGIPGIDLDAVSVSINTVAARNFVERATNADVEKLQRLNIFLHAAVRTYRSELTNAPELRGGVAWLTVDAARGLGEGSILGTAMSFSEVATSVLKLKWWQCLKVIPGVGAIDRASQRHFQDLFDGQLKSPKLHIDKTHHGSIYNAWATARYIASTQVYKTKLIGSAIVATWFNPLWTGGYAVSSGLTQTYLTDGYVRITQNGLDLVLSQLGGSTEGMTPIRDLVSEAAKGLSANRARSHTRLGEFDVAETRFENWTGDVVKCIPIVSSFAEYDKAMAVMGKGMACYSEALREMSWLRGLSNAVIIRTAQPQGIVSTMEALPKRSGQPFRRSAGLAAAQTLEASGSSGYDNAMREAEAAILVGDPEAARVQLGAATPFADSISDGGTALFGALYSAFEEGRLVVPDLDIALDSARASHSIASSARAEAFIAGAAWLAQPLEDTLKTGAVAAIQTAIDRTSSASSQLAAVTTSVLGSSSTGMVVPLGIKWPDVLEVGHSGEVSVHLWNLGGAPATDVGVTLDVNPSQLGVVDGSRRTATLIEPGAVQTLTWTIQAPGAAVADTDSVAFAPITFTPDSATAEMMLGSGRMVTLHRSPSTSVGRTGPRNYHLGVTPNPASARVSFELPPSSSEVTCTVYDILGRIYWRKTVRASETSNTQVTWDRAGTGGRKAAPGLYFVRVRNNSQEWRKTFVLLN